MRLSQIVKFAVKKKITQLFRLRFKQRRTQTTKSVCTVFKETRGFTVISWDSLFRSWSKNQLMVKKIGKKDKADK